MKTLFITTSLILILLSSGCGSIDNRNDVDVTEFEAQLLNKRWELSSFQKTDGIELDHTNSNEQFFSIEFKVEDDRPDGGAIVRRAGGGFVCNGYGAEYTLEGAVLTLWDTTLSAEACTLEGEDPALVFDNVLFDNDQIATLSFNNDRLEITAVSNEKLVFSIGEDPAPELLNTGWKMTSYKLAEEGERAAYDNGSLSFILQPHNNGTSGFMECNAFVGTYALEADLLSFLTLESDDADCSEDNEHYREQRMLIDTAIGEQLQTSLTEEGLTLTKINGDIIYFDVFPEVFSSTALTK